MTNPLAEAILAAPMRIIALEPILIGIPLRQPVSGVHGATTLQRSVLVPVTTDTGLGATIDADALKRYRIR